MSFTENFSQSPRRFWSCEENCTLAPTPLTWGRLLIRASRSFSKEFRSVPSILKSATTEPSFCWRKAFITCTGSINWLSLPSACLCASLSASRKPLVKLSIFIFCLLFSSSEVIYGDRRTH